MQTPFSRYSHNCLISKIESNNSRIAKESVIRLKLLGDELRLLKIKSQISDSREKIWSFILRMIFKILFILLINVDSFGGELPFVTYRRIRRITRDEGLRLSEMINETNCF